MRTQRTHVLALRAAQKVTALSRAARRATLNVAAGALIATSSFGCGGDSAAGTLVDAATAADAAQPDATALDPDTAGLLADILGDTAAPEEDGTLGVEDVATEDVGEPDDAALDLYEPDEGPLPDVADEADVALHDTGSGDIAAADAGDSGDFLPGTCLIPTGIPCEGFEDCQNDDGSYFLCYEGQCTEQDFNNPIAQECCLEQYENQNWGVPGCNPWGPPAPPSDRGYKLAELVGIA